LLKKPIRKSLKNEENVNLRIEFLKSYITFLF